MAHAPALLRTNTAPVFPANNNNNSPFGGISSSGISGPRSSQLSGSTGSTAFNSSRVASTAPSTNSTAPSMSAPGSSNPVATANIINQQADASRSLYQICVALRQRLAQLPGFEPYLENLDDPQTGADDDGPVESLWNLLRAGHPLLAIYNNSLRPQEPLAVAASANEAKRTKLAIFKFVEACMRDLQIPATELFVVADLTGNDTTGLVKVTQVVNHVLDLAAQSGVLQEATPNPDDANPVGPGAKMSTRDYILRELVNTERKYVQDLENLYDLKKTLEQKGVIPGDVVHQIFLNINAILDFQRRFLIRIETTNSQPPESQQWGSPFVTFEEAFNIYQPFIANQSKAAALAKDVFDKIQQTAHPVACDFNTLDGFLLKPMQRLVKYPLLLKDLLKDITKKGDDETAKADLTSGIDAAERILKKANEAVERNVLDDALEELISRVDDWKNHRVEQFGRLLRHGIYTVITGRSDQEKDYEIYLFEHILLCCKEINPNKDKSRKDKSKSSTPKPRNKSNKLQLKGRIFMTNVTEVISFAKPGSYTVQIWWKGDPGVENFVIKFTNEEMMRKWATGLDTQRKENTPTATASPEQAAPDFTWMRNVNNIENPYAQQDDEDEEEDEVQQQPQAMASNVSFGSTTSSSGGVMNRNASSTSLRGRSGTNESTASLAGVVRAPPPRFPIPPPSGVLSVQTQGGGQSPGQRAGDSYFSPTIESPASSRTSTASTLYHHHQSAHQSAQYPFPRTGTPQAGWEDNNRYTAPAMPRAPSRDGPSPVNAYGVNGRAPRGPSMPVMASHSASHSQNLAQQHRSRSYSTPDINGPANPRRNTNTATAVPTVPSIPPHLHPAHDSNIPRSQTGSPRQDIPIRTNTQSPGVQRERLQNGQGGGTMAQFPSQPVHSRQPTPSQMNVPQSLNLTNQQQQAVSPPLGTATQGNQLSSPDLPIPTQLKVKVVCDGGNYVTLVVAFNITYQSLIDRIDAKLARFTGSSIGKGNLRLRYRDEDGDLVTIESDDDIQIAFLEWREGVRNMYSGGVGEIELFCVGG